MYLSNFSKTECDAFFLLAKTLIEADKTVSENEGLLLSQFLQEMALTIDQIEPMSFDDAINVISEASTSVRKQAYIELFALAMCDADFADEEKELLASIANKMDISKEKQEEIQKCVSNLLEIYKTMNDLIME